MCSKKRGQISLFMIIGIILLLVISVTMYILQSVNNINTNNYKDTPQNVREYVEQCTEQLTYEAAYYVALNGGYYALPDYFDFNGYKVVYYYGGGIPARDEIASNMAAYITDRIPLCVNHFNNYKQKGMDITEETPKTRVTIFDNYILAEFEYPIIVKQGKQVLELKEFPSVRVPVRLGLLHNASVQVTDLFVQDPTILQISKIDDIAQALGVTIYYDWVGDRLAFVIYDPTSSIKGRYEYVFGAKFS